MNLFEITVFKLEQAQAALENTCRQNEKMMEKLESTRNEQKNSLRTFFRVDTEIQEMRKLQLCNLFNDFEMKQETTSIEPTFERQKLHEMANGLIADKVEIGVKNYTKKLSTEEIDEKINKIRTELKYLLRSAIEIDQQSKSLESFSRCHKLTNMLHPGLAFG